VTTNETPSENTAPQVFPLFTEEGSAEAVNARIGPSTGPRLRTVMEAAVRHLHSFVKEVEPTHDEWETAIEFLSETGRMCTDWRQEYVLLSDVLGVSMLVETINHRRGGGGTENTVLGPFHVQGAPHYPNGADIRLDERGIPLVVRGQVRDGEGRPIVGAKIDVWQTNEDGFYDVQQPDQQPRWNLRGLFTSDAEGRYGFITARPRFYPIPDDGPVGKLLGALGRHPNRPAHIHFIVTAPGYDQVVTHIFASDCPYLEQDAVFGVKDTLVVDIIPRDDASAAAAFGVTNPFTAIEWNFDLVPAPGSDTVS
jgi:catechol 1,2-dioxygenase